MKNRLKKRKIIVGSIFVVMYIGFVYSQRMQWYGDIKVIWPPENLVDDRWVSEMYDYGIAVAYNCRLPI